MRATRCSSTPRLASTCHKASRLTESNAFLRSMKAANRGCVVVRSQLTEAADGEHVLRGAAPGAEAALVL